MTDPHILFDIMSKLDEEHIYEWSEVEKFAEAFYDPNAPRLSLGITVSLPKSVSWHGITMLLIR